MELDAQASRNGANMDDADFAIRIEFVRSATREKLMWLSEVQGEDQ